MPRKYRRTPANRFLAIAVASLLSSHSFAAQYTLEAAVSRAQSQDPWITGSIKRQESLEAMSIEAGSLPDPSVSVSLANIPIDSFDFSQEAMTQIKVGVSQMFPRGKTLALKQEKLEKLSQTQPYARMDRDAQVAVTVAQLWLEVYRNKKTITLIENDRVLFEHLVDVAQSSYSTAMGKTRQQDLVRAQLELTRLDDRLTRLHQQREVYLAKLGEWLSDPGIELSDGNKENTFLVLALPHLVGEVNETVKLGILSKVLSNHPKIKSVDQKINAFNTNIKLAKQSYKPQWGLSASYGYRDQAPTGQDRSDFFSAGVTFDVPLFTGNRQDKKVQAATSDQAVVKTERALALRKLKAGFEASEAQYLRLVERKELFDTRLLKEMAEQAEASLSAYTNDDGDFAEVVRARIAELNARIEALNVDIDMQKIIAQINYFQIEHSYTHESNRAALELNVVDGVTHE